MKIQCPCGAQYLLDITPEMATTPVRFVCQTCGLDASDYINSLIRQELAAVEPVTAQVAPAPRLRINVSRPQAGAPRAEDDGGQRAEGGEPGTEASQFCLKHQQPADQHCLICNKPICPRCMELFGYVCSPLCRARANSHGIEIPEYENQSAVVEARQWRKVVGISVATALVVVMVLGVWIWYAWFGQVPSEVFSVKFPAPVESGQSRLCGNDQIVFLRGGSLARYDTKKKKEIWSSYLIDKKQVEKSVAREIKWMQSIIEKANNEAWDEVPKFPSREKLFELTEESLAAGLQLRVRGSNVWVADSDKLVRYDWDTGKPAEEISLTNGFGGVLARGDQLLIPSANPAGQINITHIDLVTGQSRVEEIGSAPGAARPIGTAVLAMGGAGLPVGKPGADAGKPLDPAKVAEEAQRLSTPGKIALPAVLANSFNQERIMNELKDSNARGRSESDPDYGEYFRLLPGADGHIQFGVKLIEARKVARNAMKPPPSKSALDGDVNASKTMDIANEILNEMQRSRGGEIVMEDQSRYRVTLRRPDDKEIPDWTGEVIGPPGLIPLKTINVLTANKLIMVFDKQNKKRWQASLTYDVEGGARALDDETAAYGEGPCVERGDALYVFDEAVLTAFDLATGNVRWRLPSVGVLGLFFDDKGMMYVNTTTANPDSIKYSRQIDITQKTGAIILKVDPRTGKILWRVNTGGYITHVEGKYIFTVQSYGFGDRDEQDQGDDLKIVRRQREYLRIRRLSPSDGRMLWEHFQTRAPLDVQFKGNTIQLVFQREVQVLRFLSF